MVCAKSPVTNIPVKVTVAPPLLVTFRVLARLVVKLPVAPPATAEVEAEGPITSITPPDRLEVAGKTVVVDASTRFGEHDRPMTFADLKVGDRIEVEGVAQADGTILAREIQRQDEGEHHG